MRKINNSKVFSDINITPLVDVVLVLLIIFMVTTPMLVKGIKVNLPKTSSSKSDINKKDIVISVNKHGKYYIDKTFMTKKSLLIFLKDHKNKNVVINADKSVSYGLVVNIIDMAKSAGINRVGLATQPKK